MEQSAVRARDSATPLPVTPEVGVSPSVDEGPERGGDAEDWGPARSDRGWRDRPGLVEPEVSDSANIWALSAFGLIVFLGIFGLLLYADHLQLPLRTAFDVALMRFGRFVDYISYPFLGLYGLSYLLFLAWSHGWWPDIHANAPPGGTTAAALAPAGKTD